MKYCILICLFLFSASALSFSQNYMAAGDACFKTGNYQCAKENYEKGLKQKYNQIADIKSKRANNCLKSLTLANTFFAQKKYSEAKLSYQDVIDLNPEDTYAKQQLDKCSQYQNQVTTTFTLSKYNLSFSALGGNETISVIGHTGSYSVDLLPSWCIVQKYTDYFVITCSSNLLNSERKDYFNVVAGGKTIRVNVIQPAKVESSSNNSTTSNTTLSTSTQYVYFDSQGGNSDPVKVYSNIGSYSISMIPSWCTIKYFSGYFVVVCNPNNSQSRSDWFYVNSGDKKVQVMVKQDGYSTLPTVKTQKSSNPTNLYFGVGVIKPLIFKTDGRTLSNMDFGYSFTFGFVKTVGLYAKINTNFSSVAGDYTSSTLPNVYYGITDTYSNSTFNRFGVVGGLMLKTDPIMMYLGVGKGHYYHFVKTDLFNYLDDSYVKSLNLEILSFNGLETDAGLIINLDNVGVSLGMSSFSFKYYELNVGLGIRF